MRQIIPTILTLTFVFSAPLAYAGDSGHGDKRSHSSEHKSKHGQEHRSHHVNHRSQDRHHNKHHDKRHGNNHHVAHYREPVKVRHHDRHHRHHHKAGYLLGGMFLGAVANELLSPNRSVVKETVYVDRGVRPVDQSQTFLRDEGGSCYSVEYKRHGKVLTEVSNHYCSAY